MAAVLQRATQGFAAVAVATTLVTVGIGVQKSREPVGAATSAAEDEGSQALRRPFTAPRGTAKAPPGAAADDGPGPGAARTEVNGVTLPMTVYRAYLAAQAALAKERPGCRLTWAMLAGIGQVESGQARDGALTADGRTLTPIIGPALDGSGFAAVRDTDDGRLDGDTKWDRAVGPMQFIPSTWAVWGADGNGDGVADPQNMFDAALTTGRYLCAGARDLSDPEQLRAAILSYNKSDAYADTVLGWIARYSGARSVKTTPDTKPSPSGPPGDTPPSPEPSSTLSRTAPPPSASQSPPPGPSPSGSRSEPPPGPSASSSTGPLP
ncbi:hypothetical protein GTY41_10105 [Streptomyces sp. SID685]|uniref:lytic transglycosylase domain-containing protein n=1 Tax=Streptomyces TaxID=1883 RepID=UPI00136AB987|nr:lytic murein transglycosylase [Streptomyces sp. SID685]MYR85286.1 hypothetical protein [Streptomyces sp. SID685]